MTDKSPAVELAKRERNQTEKNLITLSSGVRVRIHSVSGWLVDDVKTRVKNPPVPIWHNPDNDRDEENPIDPNYLEALREANQKRWDAWFDTLVLFGMELVDGMPEDDTWLHKLRRLEKLGHIDLTAYDLDDPVDREFMYKRRIAIGNATDFVHVQQMSSVTQEDVAKATDSFPGDSEGSADS